MIPTDVVGFEKDLIGSLLLDDDEHGTRGAGGYPMANSSWDPNGLMGTGSGSQYDPHLIEHPSLLNLLNVRK